MKTLSGYLNSKVNEEVLSEASTTSMQKATKEIQDLISAYNAGNEKFMKSYVKEVQNRIKKGNPKNVEDCIRKWMKANKKTPDSEITKDEFGMLLHSVTTGCWGYNGEMATSCDLFSMDETSYDELRTEFYSPLRKTYKNLGF